MNYVNAIPDKPTGGTDANGALTQAYAALQNAAGLEAAAHGTKGNKTFARYILLMTDGEMTGYSNQWNNKLDKDVRAKCKTIKDDGIQIYTVAFMAPDKGKSLLQNCASSAEHYFPAENATDLISAFKTIGEKTSKLAVQLTN